MSRLTREEIKKKSRKAAIQLRVSEEQVAVILPKEVQAEAQQADN